jgi:hypothetical protein
MKELTQPKKRGPKPRLVTVKLLKEIERLAARGLSQKQLCHALGFSESWWFDQKQKTQVTGGLSKRLHPGDSGNRRFAF